MHDSEQEQPCSGSGLKDAPAEPKREPQHPATALVGEDEAPLHPVLGVLFFGPMFLLFDWLIAKWLLHGQMGWLWWAPSFLLFVTGLVSLRNRHRGCAMGLATLAFALLLGPGLAKAQQSLLVEPSFFVATRPLSDRDHISGGVGEDRRTVVSAGWEVCDGLDAVKDAGRDQFGGRGPYEVTASFAAFGHAGGFDEDEDDLERDWIEFVRLADQHLC